ncbi:MAG TPA: hypothetical protein VLX90_22920 [Steroidobacteraceae bacterium]|nr:hypothetical protein [Steroidobacteraceae bacterium]
MNTLIALTAALLLAFILLAPAADATPQAPMAGPKSSMHLAIME